ncbi:DUF429 domain-containing protein [Pannonibacter tanglangensis]|uniref:DUF429 domain-containing protein n=1 Tax=Pannonibacter tanglangensis TaxID=2750084 RepID=A0ABW9ZS53_9HYPH|nr:DUF429 domain-containing protein [Pannonibacter sp. XCT-34]NBN65867.1 DUF429 domain-containing protein [Pannonibacter sp. XCT-34]
MTAAPRWIAGVDGCPAGWIAVLAPADDLSRATVRVVPRLDELLDATPRVEVLAIDMPMGLPERTRPGGRGPEAAVRPHLGARQSSVFSIPSRRAVYAPDYATACAEALATSEPPRKVSKQAFCLFPKIRELDGLLRAGASDRVYEVHPEVAFWRLNGGRAMQLPKKIKGKVNPDGLDERRALLRAEGLPAEVLQQRPPRGAAADDLVDACVCLLIARRLLEGTATPFPAEPERDACGLQMAIWA